jgi:hypothetical protein
MDLQEVGWGGMDWINQAEDEEKWRALVNQLSGSIKCGEFIDQLGTY